MDEERSRGEREKERESLAGHWGVVAGGHIRRGGGGRGPSGGGGGAVAVHVLENEEGLGVDGKDEHRPDADGVAPPRGASDLASGLCRETPANINGFYVRRFHHK